MLELLVMLALIVVYLNGPSILNGFLDSLKKNANHDFTLFIADFSSNLTIPNNKYSYPIRIIPASNRGFSHGINTCLKQA